MRVKLVIVKQPSPPVAFRGLVYSAEQTIFYSLHYKRVSPPSADVNRFHDDRFPGLESMVSSILIETKMSFNNENPCASK